jgi:hypothetical protein
MRDAGFDVSFRDRPAKGGTGSHPSYTGDLESHGGGGILPWPWSMQFGDGFWNKQTYLKVRKHSPALLMTNQKVCNKKIIKIATSDYSLWDVTQPAQIARKFTLNQIWRLLTFLHPHVQCYC